MSRKTLLFIIIIAVVTSIAIGIVAALDNPEYYREKIQATAETETGFEIEINGELKSVIVSLNGDERRTRIKVLDSTKWESCIMMINLRAVLVLNTNPNEHDDQTNVSNKALAENDGYVPRSRRRYTGRH